MFEIYVLQGNVTMKNIVAKISKEQKIAFIGTWIVGVFCYFMMMSNRFLTYDSMWNLVSEQDILYLGRQFLTYACKISSDYDLPALNGLLSIFYLSVAAALLVDVFDIKSSVFAFLTGGMLVSFPSVINTFVYSFTVDGYMLAVLLITLAFFVTVKYKWGFIAGIFLCGFSIGIYQAYFSYLIMLCIVFILIKVLDESDWKKLAVIGGKFVAVGIGGYIFYIVTLKIMLSLKHVELSGYQGVSGILNFQAGGLGTGIKTAFSDLWYFTRYGHVLSATADMKIAYFMILAVIVAIYVSLFIKNKRFKSPAHIVAAVLMIALIPVALEIFVIMAPDVYFHLLMRYGWVVILIAVLPLGNRFANEFKEKKISKVSNIVIAIICAVMIFGFVRMANIVAFNMQERYEKNYALSLRILDRLEQEEEYKTGDKVAILGGQLDAQRYPSTVYTEDILAGFVGVNDDYFTMETHYFATFYSHYMNVTIVPAESYIEEELVNSNEFMEMEPFPSKECIRKIDGVWVIKLTNTK